MGDVYLAEDTRLHRKIALKLLPIPLTDNKDRLRRFEQEARAASALNHPNILTIHEIGIEHGVHFIGTEFVNGVTLRDQMQRVRMQPDEALNIAVQITSALSAAHAAGIIHRDIKPENLMLRTDGYVKVLDFGLAKLTEKDKTERPSEFEASRRRFNDTAPGVVMGTSSYMSPEQARGVLVDARTDIWSLGVVLYEMLTGRPPFEGATTTDVIARVIERDPLPLTRYMPDPPSELQRIVTKALAKDREQRYQAAEELLQDLKALKQDLEFEAKLGRSGGFEVVNSDLPEAPSAWPTSRAPLTDASGIWEATSGEISATSSTIDSVGIERKRVVALVVLLLILSTAVALWLYLRARKPTPPTTPSETPTVSRSLIRPRALTALVKGSRSALSTFEVRQIPGLPRTQPPTTGR